MLKVFLVEDEVIIREGIKNNIDWESHGYDFCGEARDGELAYPLIQKLRPDIVITDIKMPFMDGLELSKLVKNELPATEIILLTGYEDFSYAKEAIQIGISQYLTKPISGDELIAEIDKVAEKIRERKMEQELMLKYQQEMEESVQNDYLEFFNKLVYGKNSVADIMNIAHNLEIDISAMAYNIVLYKAFSTNHEYDEYSASYVEADKNIAAMCFEKKVLTFDRGLEGKALLIKAESIEELIKIEQDTIKRIEEIFEKYPHIRYFGGIGSPVERISELSECFIKAGRAFAHRFFIKDNIFYDYADSISQTISTHEEDFDISSVDVSSFGRSRIEEFLKTGDKEEIDYFIEEFTESVGNNFFDSFIFRQYIIMDIYFTIVAFVESMQQDRSRIDKPDISNTQTESSYNSIDYIKKIIYQAMELREKTANNRYGEIIDKAIGYINDNYKDEDLSLNSLASYINLSPNHFSVMFSQQTGLSFIKYLTEYRMNKAKEMLKCTGKRSAEICLEVGYKDPHYFSYLFKKTTGMTPTQYRGVNETKDTK